MQVQRTNASRLMTFQPHVTAKYGAGFRGSFASRATEDL
jgi:hypothetical protein